MAVSNATPITGPATSPFDQISSAFAPLYSMFGPAQSSAMKANVGGGTGQSGNMFGTPGVAGAGGTGGTPITGTGGGAAGGAAGGGGLFGPTPVGGGQGPYGITPMSNPDNSLTGAWQNLFNLAGPEAMNLLTGGQSMINTGMGVTQGGLGVTAGGLSEFASPLAFTNALLSGNPTATAMAIAPQMANASAIESGALNQANQGIRGGYNAVNAANRPQWLAALGGNFAQSLLPWAATTQAGFGKDIAGIGTNISTTGQEMVGHGETLTGQGSQALDNLIRDTLQKMSINITGGTSNTLPNWVNSILALLGGSKNLIGGSGTQQQTTGVNLPEPTIGIPTEWPPGDPGLPSDPTMSFDPSFGF
ncbi:MAG TPA: hypothetical protein VIX37_04710 [Candidatus Sulfotelmatobacter sp.]